MADATPDLLIRGGTLVSATDTFVADVAIREGRITAIGLDLPGAAQEVDARSLQVLPGGVDVHTHLDAPVGEVTAIDDFESGTAAGACGGITTICDYAWQRPGESLAQGIDAWKRKALGKARAGRGARRASVTSPRLGRDAAHLAGIIGGTIRAGWVGSSQAGRRAVLSSAGVAEQLALTGDQFAA